MLLLVPVSFFAGRLTIDRAEAPQGRKILYYVDPMNPSFRSPEPGIAPRGMPLEPVYADGAAPAAGGTAPGAVTVAGDRLQLIGVAKEAVNRRTVRHTLRLVGTVAPDEARLFRISAATAGQVREMGRATTGSLVAKGEILGAFYTADASFPQQNYIRLLLAHKTFVMSGHTPKDPIQIGQITTYNRNLEIAREVLLNLGMAPEQIEEIGRMGMPDNLVQIRAGAAGFVVSRSISLGQSFEAGEDLFTLADLSRVRVLADAFEGQERFFSPGAVASIALPGGNRPIAAVVSPVLPRFDQESRTLKVQLEAPNPGYLLRPGMFVPRTVRTGQRAGELVEIVAGLMEGETVVTSGNFLLDSESRMRASGAQAAGEAIDPICGMEVDSAEALASGLVSRYGETTWYFCTPTCQKEFERDPGAYALTRR